MRVTHLSIIPTLSLAILISGCSGPEQDDPNPIPDEPQVDSMERFANDLVADVDLASLTLGVVPFAHMPDSEVSRASQYVAGLVPIQLRRTLGRSLRLYTRQYIDHVLEEQTASSSRLYSQASASEVGRLIGLSHLVVGELWLEGTTLRLRAQLVSVESGEIVNMAEASVELAKEDQVFLTGEPRRLETSLSLPKEVPADPEIASWMEKGWSYFEQENVNVATQFFRNVVQKDPEEVNGWLGLAHLAFGERQYDESIKLYSTVIGLVPDSTVGLANRGAALILSGEVQRGLEDCNRTLEIDPDDVVALSNRAGARLNLGKFRDALADAERAVSLSPNHVIAMVNSAAAMVSLGRLDDAIARCTKAIEIEPGYHQSYAIRSSARLLKQDIEGALEDCRQALSLNDQDPIAWTNQGTALNALGQLDESLKSLNRALEIQPGYPTALASRANNWVARGEFDKAIEDASAAIERSPNDVFALAARGSAYLTMGEERKAIEDFDRTIELSPGFVIGYFNRGAAYYNIDDYPPAIADFTKVLELQPDNLTANYYRGLAYVNSGDRDRGIAELQGVIQRAPGTPLAQEAQSILDQIQ